MACGSQTSVIFFVCLFFSTSSKAPREKAACVSCAEKKKRKGFGCEECLGHGEGWKGQGRGEVGCRSGRGGLQGEAGPSRHVTSSRKSLQSGASTSPRCLSCNSITGIWSGVHSTGLSAPWGQECRPASPAPQCPAGAWGTGTRSLSLGKSTGRGVSDSPQPHRVKHGG